MFGYFIWWQTTACGRGIEGDINQFTADLIVHHLDQRLSKAATKYND